jgi:hypothetical protein
MNHSLSDVELADRLARRRARVLRVSALLFVIWQVNFFVVPGNLDRTVDHLRISAWLVWAVALLLLLASGGGLLRRRSLRPLMEDEVTKAHRRSAFSVGFWAAVGTAILVYFLTMFEPVSGREACHLIITAAVAGALLTFATLERRALKDG